ncbi:MAG: nuclear transport factor 2 family protein [Gammaproteobacteria bacterium]|nr:nuclear transport factor 2 family protein [Gammaproteobacteria bacterium]MBT4492291.1 nuclear transport factor 2 family protein [Gammaproteobacteria bacterium]
MLLAGCTVMKNPGQELHSLEDDVREVEAAFAKTMADRDFEAFQRFLAVNTIFFAGEEPIRGRQAVADAWEPFYQGKDAPFSWEPVTVAVQDSGELALSSGPVYGADGVQVAVFQSIWRREPDGDWKIVFDKGGQYCPPQDD